MFPQASAGAIFQAAMSSGKFQGMICAHREGGRDEGMEGSSRG